MEISAIFTTEYYQKLKVAEKATLSNFVNEGIASINQLSVTGQGVNKDKLKIASIEGSGSFNNHGQLDFIGSTADNIPAWIHYCRLPGCSMLDGSIYVERG